MKPEEKTSSEILNIIDTRTPRGLFYCKNESGGFTGVDNHSGDAWTEDFNSFKECINWLEEGI